MKKFSALLAIGLFAAAGYAAQQTINVGSSANDGTGDTLRSAFVKVNDNFTELYNEHSGVVNFGGTGTITNAAGIGTDGLVTIFGSSNKAALVVSDDKDNNSLGIIIDNFGVSKVGLNSYGLRLYNGATVEWSSSSAIGSTDLSINRDAANTLAQRNGANAQTSRLYSTYTDSSNYERLALEATLGNINIAAQTSGTGSDDIDITLSPAGAGVVNVAGVLDGNSTGTITNLAQLDVGQYGVAGASAFRIDPDSATGKPFGFTRASDGLEVLSINTGGYLYAYGVTSGTLLSIGDVQLYRDAASTLSLRYGTAPTSMRISGTYTDASNYERLSLSHDGSGTGTIAVETSGTGSANQSLKLQLAGNGALYVDGDTAGNARGSYAVDLQNSRNAATQVASAYAATISGGSYNTATASYATVSGGQYNSATSSHAAVGGGYINSATGGQSVVSGGIVNSASGTYSSISGGAYASAYLYAQESRASGRFAANGDAQYSRLIARNTTSGTTPADLFLDGSSAKLVLPNNTTWKFVAEISARSTDAGAGNEESAAYEISGLIERDSAAADTRIVGTPIVTTVAEDDAAWTVAASADTTNGALTITCTGNDETTVRWVAVVRLVEVGG